MKRLASLFLALILACSLMACGAKDDSTKDDPDTSEKTYKIALVMPTMRNDQFCISAYNGFMETAAQYDGKVETIVCECEADADYEEQMRACVAEGVDMLIGLSWQAGTGIDAVAKDFPDACKYVLIDSTVDNENVVCIGYYDAEGAYLIGMLAGLICDDLWNEGDQHVYGCINVTQSASSWQWRYGYYEGVKAIDPDAVFTQNYVLGYSEVNLAHDYATQMAELGCKFVNSCASGGDPGTFAAALEKGVYTSGQVSDLTDPENPYIASCQIKDSYATIKYVMDKFMTEGPDGWINENLTLGVAEGAIGAVHVTHESKNPIPEVLTADDIAQLKDVAAQMKDGTLSIDLHTLPEESAVSANYTLIG